MVQGDKRTVDDNFQTVLLSSAPLVFSGAPSNGVEYFAKSMEHAKKYKRSKAVKTGCYHCLNDEIQRGFSCLAGKPSYLARI